MISLASSIHTNVDQSATLVQPREKLELAQATSLSSSSNAQGNSSEKRESDQSHGGGSKSNDSAIFKKAASQEDVFLYSKSNQVRENKQSNSAPSDDKEVLESSEVNSNDKTLASQKGKEIEPDQEQSFQENQQKLTDLKVVSELEKRDREVRQHEQAHAMTGGQHAGAPNYQYETGPDGKKYAVGGEVNVDMSFSGKNPEEKLEKAQIIRAAALAPREPSPQDRKVAAEASRVVQEAQTELVKLKTEDKSNPAQNEHTDSTTEKADKKELEKELPPILGADKADKNDSSANESSHDYSMKKADAHINSESEKDNGSPALTKHAEAEDVSAFIEKQSRMRHTYDKVLQAGHHIDENHGAIFKYAELSVIT